MQREINLRQKRDFGQLISHTFDYLKLHFIPLMKLLLLTAGPLFILAAFLVGGFYSNMLQVVQTADETQLMNSMQRLFGGFLFYFIAFVLLKGLIVEYMNLSLYKPKKEIKLNDVFNAFWKNIGRYLLATLLIALVAFAAMLAFILPAIWVSIVFSLFFFIIGVENKGVGDAFQKSFQLMKGFWWRTFGLVIVIGMIQSAFTYAVTIPIYIVMGISKFSSLSGGDAVESISQIAGSIVPVSMFISGIAYSISIIASGINYFSIVEAKEEVGLKARLMQMEDKTENEA